jgi:hypothetical protein
MAEAAYRMSCGCSRDDVNVITFCAKHGGGYLRLGQPAKRRPWVGYAMQVGAVVLIASRFDGLNIWDYVVLGAGLALAGLGEDVQKGRL